MNRRKTGSLLEEKACDILKKEGYKIVDRNFRAGRIGEIDIVAREGEYICFIEVKGRRSISFGTPAEAVGYEKRSRIRRVSSQYIVNNGMHNQNIRYDVLELYYKKAYGDIVLNKYNLIRNAF